MARKADLENSIHESYAIIRGYEARIQTSDRPEERLRAQRTMDEQWSLIRGYLDEYRTLAGNALPDDIAQIAAHFSTAEGTPQAPPVKQETEQVSSPAPRQPGQPPRQTYKDYTLKLGRLDKDTYSVEAQGPTGEAKTTFEQPFDEKDIRIFWLEVGRPRRTAVRGRVPEPMQQTVDFGGQLYNTVLSGDVRDTFVSARHEAQREGYGLRVKLRLTDTPDLADLPWEFLYDGHDFLALSPDTPVVRYLDLPKPPRPMEVDLPLRVLVTTSSPHDLQELDLETEQATICEALQGMAGLVKVEVIENITLNALQRALRRARREGHPYHIWHYIGHGSFDAVTQSSVLLFCDKAGLSSPVGGFQLGALFAGYPELRLAVLNACEGARPDIQDPFAGVAAALVGRGVPAVVGMQSEFTDEAALAFSEEFYTALVDGLPVDTAVTEARRAVFFMPNWVEWAWPVLYMRAPDGVLFDVQMKAAQQTELEQPLRPATEPSAASIPPGGLAALPRTLPRHQPFEPKMVLIPAGEFLMGSDPQHDRHARDNEQPQRALCLLDYYIAETPVTNEQYLAFVEATGYTPPDRWKSERPEKSKEDHPVGRVSWRDARVYCQWLAEATGRHYALPSEAEWEKSARGKDGRIYPWGNEWDANRCNTSEGGIGNTTPVGQYPLGASPYGVLDVAGNVWEWTRSLYAGYPYDPGDGREELDVPGQRVVRGGSWYLYRDVAQCVYRHWYDPDFRSDDLGFRVVVSPISSSDR